jgi:hypothetical protein
MELVESFVHFPPIQRWQEQRKLVLIHLIHRISTVLSLLQLT